ncbi:glycosyltransferase involved in cell wall biosynthesis [Rhizobium binae]|uniref:Glycosyltransferase involved in cell wall biosynthesis n=1 Tax=Rhizobium binae TaxID=1138190 RepID=A0ABV2MQN1_9HYPH|nr:glycosyltransferase family 2 protein [Rhizobium binae]MBX4994143.1 glycosyltransferase family 2 protein [Rhizobium binae]NKL51776.1 glycosyltransferase [Rhizobium leguminosarum bv. viciae]QSY82994.1 glycosyltransferase family 2 protein [Rhizobium binae]
MIEILCATYNGMRHLREQIASIEAQTLTDWHVTFFDDGSTDGTVETLAALTLKDNRFTLIQNATNLGFCGNFLNNLSKLKNADAYAFSDQDDIWYPDKLERAFNWLARIDAGMPAVYFARTEVVDEHLNHAGLSPQNKLEPSFRNAVVQSIGGGNTMMFNSAARNLVVDTLPEMQLISHDWWFYIVVSGCGGIVRYDPEPVLKYRQHAGNLVGANNSISGQILRLWRAFRGQWRAWNAVHELAIKTFEDRLTPENRAAFCAFLRARHGAWPFERLSVFKSSGIRRQSQLQTRFLPFLALLNRL